MHAGDEDPGDEPVADGRLALDQWDVRDDDARLAQQPQLDPERRGAPERLEERLAAEQLRDDDVDELRVASG